MSVKGGGPAIVRNNVVMGGIYGGIYSQVPEHPLFVRMCMSLSLHIIQNYLARNLQYNIYIYWNTILNNNGAGIITENWVAGK